MNHQQLIDKAAIKLCPIGIKLIAEENDISMSRAGRNTVYHGCDIYQGRPSYATCLMVIEAAHNANESVGRFRPECFAAVANKTCPALEMRKEEIKAKRALFFVDYVELMRRRKEANDLAILNSPIQFRRNNRNPPRFVPTQSENIPSEVRESKRTKVVEKDEGDIYNTNIMETVLKKVLNDDTASNHE